MSGRRGFTLIEVLISTMLFAFLMGSYYAAFISIIQAEDYARDQRHFGSIGPAVMDLFEDDILSLYAHPRALDAFPFRGDDDSMSGEPADRLAFVARRASIHQEEMGTTGIYVRSPINEVGYRLARNDSEMGDVRRLYRRESYYVDGTPMQGGNYFEIYDRVVSFDVVYAGYQVEEEARTSAAEGNARRLEKFESWDSEERKGFPTAVIITLVIEPPRLGVPREGEDKKAIRRQTLVRIIRPPQWADVPASAATGPANPASPGTGNQGTNR